MTNILFETIARYNEILNACNKEIEIMNNPQKYGCCVCNCNSIVIDKERMLTIKTGEGNKAEFEFNATYPTYYTPKTAKWITENIKLVNGLGKPIKLEIVGKYEYYNLLKEHVEKALNAINGLRERA